MRYWFIILAFLPLFVFGQTKYYFSSENGDDGNLGTSEEEAWQSMYKLRDLITNDLTDYDSVYFERGSKWDTCRIFILNLDNVYFGAYGSGTKPKFTGSLNISGGFTQNGNYWSITNALFNNDDSEIRVVEGLYINDVWYHVSRYPDYPTLATSESCEYGSLTDNDASWTTNEWVGATVTRADIPYAWRARKVTSNTSTQLVFANMDEEEDVMNYIIYNDSSAMNMNGEWAYNSTTQRLTVYYTGDLNTQIVDFVVDTSVFYIDNCSGLTFDNLDIGRANRNVINGDIWSDISFINCNIHDAGNCLVFVYYNNGGTGIVFTNNTIYNANASGLAIGACGFTINNNYFHNIAINPGLITSPNNDFTLPCIINQWSNGEISYNRFDSIVIANIGSGWNGNSTIHHNVITNYGINHGDIAAFYFAYDNENSYQKRYYKNLILDVGDPIETRTNTNEKYAHAIYLDANNYNVIFDSVTVANAHGGYLQNSNDDGDTLTNSKFYNANKQGGNDDWQNVLFINDELWGNNDNGYVSNNTFCLGSESQGGNEQRFIFVLDHAPDLEMTLTNNKYLNPYVTSTEFCRFMESYSIITEYTFSQMQGLGYESGSSYDNTLYDTTLVFINWTDSVHTFDYSATLSVDEDGNSLPGKIDVSPYYSEIIRFNGLNSISDEDYIFGSGYVLLIDSLFGSIEESGTPPSGGGGDVATKYEYHTFSESNYGVLDSLSQSFTVGTIGSNVTHTLDSIGVKFSTSDGTVSSITFTLYAADHDTLSGSILSTGIINTNIPTGAASLRYITMSSYELQPSTSYVIVASAIGGNMRWAQDITNGYAGGKDAYRNSNAWVVEDCCDAWFEVWGHQSTDFLLQRKGQTKILLRKGTKNLMKRKGKTYQTSE